MKRKFDEDAVTTTESIRTTFSEEEIGMMKDSYMQKGLQIVKLDQELKAIKKNYKAKVESLKTEQYELSSSAVAGYTDVDMEVVNEPNQGKGVMEFYDKQGTLVGERKLRPAEKRLLKKAN